LPYVKTMFGAVMKLKGACSQAVHNKERCTALAECVWLHRHPMNFVRACACGVRVHGACRWLQGLCTVLIRIVEAHEKRGALHTNVIERYLFTPGGFTSAPRTAVGFE
jgi:hypothetical protein